MRTFNKCNILVPENVDFSKWSVVACDQYTSEQDYWDSVKENVGDAPSTLNIIYPEIYLQKPDKEERIKNIHKNMEDYQKSGLFKEYKNSLVYVERTQRDGRTRYGLVGTVDLEQYDFSKGSTSLIRATEGTVLDRIPPRVSIRLEASLELPHILMLIDDRKAAVIEPLKEKKDSFQKLYDFDLQMNSGHLTGYLVSDEAAEIVLSAIEDLEDKKEFSAKYNTDAPVLQFAVGDGNHSLATAKTCWEEIKKGLSPEEAENHPARFALVELMNVHDKTLEFEPIHRVVFDIDPEKLMAELKNFYECTEEADEALQKISWCYKDKKGELYIKNPSSKLAVGTLGNFLDKYVSENGGEIDYIHGADVVEKLAAEENRIGFILPNMEKNELFETVIADGALPRKTFSMGEAHDKKFYMECKKIRL